MRRIAAVLVVLTLALAGLLAWRLRAQEEELRRPAGGSGEIEGTRLAVASKLSARIAEVKVKKGQSVKKGDLLAALDCAEPTAAVAEAEARLASARAQAEAARAMADAAKGTEKAASASIGATKAQAAALAAQRDAAKRQAERLGSVGEDVAASNLDQIKSSASGLEHQFQAAQASSQASAAQALAAAGQAKAASAQALAAEETIRAGEAALARSKLLLAECELRAPRDALVEEVPFEAGELVGPGSVLVRLVDLREVKAVFYLPNAELGAARTGAKATVVADAWPDQPFEGRIASVALEAEFTPRNIQTRTDRDRLVYPVEVAIPNPDLKLRPGMPVQVTLPGTER